jgi:hypothetical protein
VAVGEPLLHLLGVLDDVVALEHDRPGEGDPRRRRGPPPRSLPHPQPREERDDRDQDRRVVGEVHPLDVEDEAEQPLALIGAARERGVLLPDLGDVLGLVRGHDREQHGEEHRRGPEGP